VVFVRRVEDVGHKLYVNNYISRLYPYKKTVMAVSGLKVKELPKNLVPKPSKLINGILWAEFMITSRQCAGWTRWRCV
jgi:hypothetical protein